MRINHNIGCLVDSGVEGKIYIQEMNRSRATREFYLIGHNS
jgi:hypothetical protein